MLKPRIVFLLLLAMLIPLRGAVAAAMLCQPSGLPQADVQAHVHHEGMDHHDAASALHAVDATAGDGGHHAAGNTGTGTGTCTLCAACCSAASLLGHMPEVAAPPDLSAAPFPDISAPQPSFLSDGQERPPRSI